MTNALASRVFTPVDQETFASLSGDRNPMHMDEDAAKRTQAGSRVVHGVHASLWMLEQLAKDGLDLSVVSSLKVKFANFIMLNQPVSLHVLKKDASGLKAEAQLEDGPSIAMTLKLGEKKPHNPAAANSIPATPVELDGGPLEPAFEELLGNAGWLAPPPAAADTARAHFPTVSAALGAEAVTSLALLSTVVGMVVPGLHSIFSDFSVEFGGEGNPEKLGHLGFKTMQADPRFRMANVSIEGTGFSGELAAYMRFPPFSIPRVGEIATRVAKDRFQGRTALIIGGSRGIGAVTAKLIAAGGAKVIASYASNRKEAEKLKAEIDAFRGEPACEIFHYDVTAPGEIPSADIVTHAYYSATPKIFHRGSTVFSKARHEKFLDFYVDGFYALVQKLLSARAPKQKLNLLYPSSIAVAEHPKGMTEYAMAKAAGEILCADLARAYPDLKIAAPRLPRILTDQTATVPPVEAADALAVMLPLLEAEAD